MSRKMIQKLAIGQWSGNTFTLCDQQPQEDITDLGSMLAWAKQEYHEKPGSYAFVRIIPGGLGIVLQTSFFAKFGMPEDEDTVPAE